MPKDDGLILFLKHYLFRLTKIKRKVFIDGIISSIRLLVTFQMENQIFKPTDKQDTNVKQLNIFEKELFNLLNTVSSKLLSEDSILRSCISNKRSKNNFQTGDVCALFQLPIHKRSSFLIILSYFRQLKSSN